MKYMDKKVSFLPDNPAIVLFKGQPTHYENDALTMAEDKTATVISYERAVAIKETLMGMDKRDFVIVKVGSQ